MLTMSHIAMAKNILMFLQLHNLDILEEQYFIYGNIKPDMLFQKTPKIHLEKESLSFILKQIEYLKQSNIDKKTMSVNLGVVCHYLCDYFCLPHFERWSKTSFNKKIVQVLRHLNYEKNLCFYTSLAKTDFKNIENIEQFLNDCKKEYVKTKSYENDIVFASLVCNSIVFYILK